jgi:hypothetical protein
VVPPAPDVPPIPEVPPVPDVPAPDAPPVPDDVPPAPVDPPSAPEPPPALGVEREEEDEQALATKMPNTQTPGEINRLIVSSLEEHGIDRELNVGVRL